MQFQIFGPFDIPLDEGHANWLDSADIRNFWNQVVNLDQPELSNACGVYIFGMRGADSLPKRLASSPLPWYVGKAEKQSFAKECFTGRNRNIFNKIISQTYKGRGTPFLFLLARIEKDNKTFSVPTTETYPGVAFVEKMMIQMSMAVNTNIENTSFTADAKKTIIRGILNSKGKVTNQAQNFKSIFRIENQKPIQLADDKKRHPLKYEIYGPYEIPFEKIGSKPKVITPGDVESFWQDIECKGDGDLKNNRGIYIYSLKKTKLTIPWFIGSSSENTTLGNQAFCSYRDMYAINKIFTESYGKQGNPLIYFLALLSKGTSATVQSNIRFVKSVLLEYGVQVNGRILSDDAHEMNMWRDLYVEGFVNANQGQPRRSVKELKELLRSSSDKQDET